ncbi:Uncharacterised protein [Weissella viridescens]|uniref:Uncharacterized protein n=1 Tax=Weissella viridescens TaxID=1629 RepID=A0A380NWH8_WEIVI|nr:Uncharacterised protein [Weissella viridescens]
MAIYFMLFPVIGIIYLVTNNQYFSSRRAFVFFSFAFLGTFAAMRANTVGTDTLTYETIFPIRETYLVKNLQHLVSFRQW